MALKKQDWVKVSSLRREGQIMEVLRSGQYKVLVGGLAVQCAEKDLLFLPDGPTDRDEEKPRKKKSSSSTGSSSPSASPSIDLHGMLVEEAMEVVGSRVNQAIMGGADSLRVVHGKGSGKIKAALHRYLGTLGVVKRFKLDEQNPGVTWVYF